MVGTLMSEVRQGYCCVNKFLSGIITLIRREAPDSERKLEKKKISSRKSSG